MRVAVVAVTPSPYQRDLFLSLSRQTGIDLEVFYLEHAPDDTPWARVRFFSWESVIPGRVIGRGRVRCHINSPLPDLRIYDAVIVNAPLTASTTQRLMRLLRAHTIPWVFWAEQLLPRHGWRGAVQRVLASPLSHAHAIVAIGSQAVSDYRRRFPHLPIHNLPYSCDLEPFREASSDRWNRSSAPSSCNFFFAGQMIARKGIDVLIEAFRALVDAGLNITLTLVGRQADLPRFLEPQPTQVKDRVSYLGFRQPSQLPETFASADVFVLPSRHDGWGVVVNQALGAGLPIITTTAAGAGLDLVTPGKEGLHVPPDDAKALATAMRTLATDPDLRKTMSTNATAKAEAISPEAMSEKWHQLLTSLACPSAASGN